MGDRYHLSLKCAYCGKWNDTPDEMGFPPIYYAPSCGVTTFKCVHCGKTNKIQEDFKAIKE